MNARPAAVLRRSLAILLAATALACGRGDESPKADGTAAPAAAEASAAPAAPPDPASHRIRLDAAQLAAAGIEVAAAGPGSVDSGTELVGEVHPNGDRLAHITPRFPGIVREVFKGAGDPVRAGDVLAVIESSDSLAPYSVKTAIDGIVIAKDLTRGEAVERTKQAFVVADLASVWVDLAVYQKDLGRIAIGQRVHIDAVGEGPAAEGRISYVTPSVDQVTRTATARIVLANPERRFLPGMFVTAHTLDSADAAVAVPRDAIQTIGGQPCVFVVERDGVVRRPIVLGRQGSELVEVVTGLGAGERIAVKNVFLLKAELAKGEAGRDE
jgi:membrane fusion protein, heavy metal efflux system